MPINYKKIPIARSVFFYAYICDIIISQEVEK